MKKITKFFSALLALLAVGLITVSLVACSSGDDSDSGNGNGGNNVDYVAKYAYTEARDDYKSEKTFIFYKNGTFEYIDEMTLSGEHSYREKETEAKGTYTLEEGNWENGKVKLNATEGDKASNYKGTFTIKDKVLKTDFYDFTATYTSKVEADSGKDNSDTNKDKDSGKDTSSDSKTTGSATFSGTAWGETVTAEFYENGTYVQYRNGTPDEKGTYKFKNGDFDNGTLTCTESYEYKNGGWVSLLDDDIFDCTITNGVLSNKYTTMWGFTMTKTGSSSSESGNTDTNVKTYTVTFNSNGGSSVTSQKVTKGEKAKKPTDPTKDGYDFEGWKDENGSSFNFNTTINSDITLTASWKKIETSPEIDDRDLPSAVLKSKLPASVGTDPFNSTSWKYTKWGEVMKVTFNNGIMEVSKSNKKDATYYYSYDATNKRLYYIFRTKWDDGKEYTSVEAYAKKDDKSLLKYAGCPADYVEAHGKWQTIWFEQVNSISYEETESGITIEPYFNGNFTGLTGGEFYEEYSGSSQISGYDDGSHGISVKFEANRGSDGMDYSKKSIQGYVTAVNGNTLTCTAVVYNESVTGTFTVEVNATPAKGNDAKATMTIKAIDEDLKFICGQNVGAVSSEMKFSASLTDNEKKWTKVN